MIAGVLTFAAYESVVVAYGNDAVVAKPDDGPLVGALAPPPAAAMAPSSGETEVRVDIAWRADLRPLEREPACRLLVCDQVVDGEVEWLAGTASLPLVEARPGDQQLLEVAVGGRRTLRLVRLRADGVTVRLGADVLVAGQVVDADGEAVASAHVWVAGVEAKTDAAGEFEVPAVGGEGLPLVAWADGMAAQTLVLEAWCNSTVRVVLAPAAQVRVRAIGAVGAGQAPARVVVLPAREPRTAAEAQYPYFLQALTGGAPVSSKGFASLTNLPVGIRVRLLVTHDNGVAESLPSIETRTRPSEASVLMQAAGEVRGTVARRDGGPAAGAWVALWPSDAGRDLEREVGASCALPPAGYCARGSVRRCDATGAFRLPRSPRHGEARLLALGHTFAAEVSVLGRGEVVHDLTLPDDAVGDPSPTARLQLHAPPGDYRVHVVEHGLTPRPSTRWTATVPFPIPLRSAAMADVTVTIAAPDAPWVRSFPALAIVGDVDVALPSGR